MDRTNEGIFAIYEGLMGTEDFSERIRQLVRFGCTVDKGGVGIVSVEDALSDQPWYMGSYTSLRSSIETLLGDDEVKEIALLINSPGGDVLGLFECCDYIKQAKALKPIHAHVTGMCCSAAYAIASACTDITATETSQIGSIGVISDCRSYEKYDEKRGILSRIFRSRHAQKKVASPFTEEGAKALQEKLDFYEDRFYDLISGSRGKDRQECIDTYGNGEVFLSQKALDLGMIDAVATYGDFMQRLTSSLQDRKEEEEEQMDISKMGAEERADLFKALAEAEPGLVEGMVTKAKAEERERITSLLSNRTDANAELIDAAIADGRKDGEIAMELFRIEKARAEELKAKVVDPMEQIALKAQAQQDVVPPAATGASVTDPDSYQAKGAEIARGIEDFRKEAR